MLKKRFLSILLIFSILIPMAVFALPNSAAAAEEIDILARGVCLIEANTGKVLYAKNADDKMYPASTTKVMTVLLAVEAIEAGDLSTDTVYTAPDDLYFDMSSDSSTQNIKAGEEMMLYDILRCALVTSANEACNWLAQIVAGDHAAFVKMMNDRAKALGCRNTNFVNTHGLQDENHYVTASDMARIYMEARKNKLFIDLASTVSYNIEPTNLSDMRSLTNTNKLLVKNSGYYYEYCTGGKTGSTSAAGYCLASSASKGDLDLISVVMGAEAVSENQQTTIQSFSETARLFQWGFDNFSYRTVLEDSWLLTEVAVEMGSDTDSVILRPSNSITALLDNAVVEEDIIYDFNIYHEKAGVVLEAPIKAGETLGEVSVYCKDEYLGTADLVANTAVSLSKLEYMTREVKAFFALPLVWIVIILFVLMLVAYIVLVIRYNIIRRRIRAEKRARREEALRQRQSMATGKSFEEIEKAMAGEPK